MRLVCSTGSDWDSNHSRASIGLKHMAKSNLLILIIQYISLEPVYYIVPYAPKFLKKDYGGVTDLPWSLGMCSTV